MFSFVLGICLGYIFSIVVSALGTDQVKRQIISLLERATGENYVDLNFALNDAEAPHFAKNLTGFVTSISIDNYEIDPKGWVYIRYAISGMKIVEEDRKVLKRSICLELHNYLLENHGVDTRTFYISTLTDNIIILKIAASPMAQREFHNLKFSEKLECTDEMIEE